MTLNEQSLLRYLAARPGRTVDGRQLADYLQSFLPESSHDARLQAVSRFFKKAQQLYPDQIKIEGKNSGRHYAWLGDNTDLISELDETPSEQDILKERLTELWGSRHLLPARDWQDLANCKDLPTDSFYPEKGGSTSAAKLICSRCVVQDECLDQALRQGERFGVHGGLSERDRRELADILTSQTNSNAVMNARDYILTKREASFRRARSTYTYSGVTIDKIL